MVILRCLAAAFILLFFFPFSSGDSQEAPLRSGPSDTEIRDFIRRVNALRQNSGCPELKWDDRIGAVAQGHSRDMVAKNFYSHTNPDGKDPFDRLREADIDFSAAAENIASGPKTGKEAYLIWLNSPNHRGNILDCRFLYHGVGRVRGRWTHIFIKP